MAETFANLNLSVKLEFIGKCPCKGFNFRHCKQEGLNPGSDQQKTSFKSGLLVDRNQDRMLCNR